MFLGRTLRLVNESGGNLPCAGATAGSSRAAANAATTRIRRARCIAVPPERVTHSVRAGAPGRCPRSEEHTSELQSHLNLVCRLLLEKKKRSDPDRKSTRLKSTQT